MSRHVLLPFLLVLLAAVPAPAEDHGGIAWEGDFQAGLERAALEGRPVLLAINALENEAANQRLAHQLYPSPGWGRATREYVCFPCNGNTHGDGESCTRYEDIPCRAHKDALNYVLKRFGPDQISPQHIVLDPDGGVAYRKSYYTGVVGPKLLERLWPRIAPELAYGRAGDLRADEIDELDQTPLADVTEAARTWLRSGDSLAVAGVLRALDFAYEDERKLALVNALDAAPDGQLPVLDLLADEAGTRVTDMPDVALALADALLDLDRARGVRLLARIAARSDTSLRRKALARWKPNDETERAARVEARLLGGDTAGVRLPSAPDEAWALRLARAANRAGKRSKAAEDLGDALEDGRSGPIFLALLEARPAEVQKHEAAVRVLFRERPFRLRAAAAVALLGAKLAAGGRLAAVLWEAVNDPVEGEEVRLAAVRHLGEDPGWNEEVWAEAVQKRLGGAR